MSLNIKDPTTEALARQLAEATGEAVGDAVRIALEERLQREQAKSSGRRLADRLDEIALHCASLPRRRSRSEDEILGYDDRGLPA